MDVSPKDRRDVVDPWTLVTRKYYRADGRDDPLLVARPAPPPAKDTAPAVVRRRAARAAAKRADEEKRQRAVAEFKRFCEIRREHAKPQQARPQGSLALDLKKNPHTVEELLDRCWTPEHFVASRSKRR